MMPTSTKKDLIAEYCEAWYLQHGRPPSGADIMSELRNQTRVPLPSAQWVRRNVSDWRHAHDLGDTAEFATLDPDTVRAIEEIDAAFPVPHARPQRRDWNWLRSAPDIASWLLVMGFAFGLSTWSLFDLAIGYGVPKPLALGLSAVLDGAALLCGKLRLAHARDGESGGLARFFVLLFVAGSAYLNFVHGQHWGTAAQIAFAAPAIVAVVVFELKSRHIYRRELAAHNRIAEPLPAFGWLTYALHPRATLGKISAILASRLNSVPVTVLDYRSTDR